MKEKRRAHIFKHKDKTRKDNNNKYQFSMCI